MKIGQVCVKTAGRDAGKICIIIDDSSDGMVIVDGLTRRKKCNVRHLMWLGKIVDVKKNASHEEVLKHLTALGVKIVDKGRKKARDKKSEKPVKKRKSKKSPEAKEKKK